MHNPLNKFWVVFALSVLSAPVVWSQQQEQQQQGQQQGQEQQGQQGQSQASAPIPAYHSPLANLSGSADQGQTIDPSAMTPDTTSLTGVQNIGLGTPANERSYWLPSVNVNTTFDSDALSATAQSGWANYTSLLGMLELHKISGTSDFSLNYAGGGTISSDSEVGNSVIQEFEGSEKISFRRAEVSIFDQATYLPETGLGYGGLGGVPGIPGGGIGLQNPFLPGQSILTTRGQRLSNSFDTQLDVDLTHRTSLTFVGGYSLLHFFDNSLLNVNDATFQAGYNYQLTRKDTIAVLYNFTGYRYSGYDQSINDNRFNFSYGRRVTGRLAFQAAAGPDVVFLRMPLTASSSTQSSASPSSSMKLYWSMNTSLNYLFQRSSLAASYTHGVNGGSGVFAGSISDIVTGTVNHQISRTFSGGIDFGYARNEGLNIDTTTPSNQVYGYWFGGITANHTWGREVNLFVNYQFQYQDSNSAFCIGPTCGSNFIRHVVSVGVSWRDHPIAF